MYEFNIQTLHIWPCEKRVSQFRNESSGDFERSSFQTYHGLEAEEDPSVLDVIQFLFAFFLEVGNELPAVGWWRRW